MVTPVPSCMRKPVLPLEMYAKLLSRLNHPRDRAIFAVASCCALRPSEMFGLLWSCDEGNVFRVVNTAWRGNLRFQRTKRRGRVVPATLCLWAMCGGQCLRRQ